jgi:hypothetical protein
MPVHSLPPDANLVYTSQAPHAQDAMSMPPNHGSAVVLERGNDMSIAYPLQAHHTIGMPSHGHGHGHGHGHSVGVASERHDVDNAYATQQRQNACLPRTASSERRDVNINATYASHEQHQNLYVSGQSGPTERHDVNVSVPYMQQHNMMLPRAVSSEAREMTMVYNPQMPSAEAPDINVNLAYMAHQHQHQVPLVLLPMSAYVDKCVCTYL